MWRRRRSFRLTERLQIGRASRPKRLRFREIKTEQLTPILSHSHKLTPVEMFRSAEWAKWMSGRHNEAGSSSDSEDVAATKVFPVIERRYEPASDLVDRLRFIDALLSSPSSPLE